MATIGDYLGTNLNYSNYDLSQLSDEELQKVLMSYDIYKDSEYVSNLPSINPKTFGYNNPFNINAPNQALPQTSIDAYSSGTGSEITMPDPFNVRSNLPPYKSQNFGERNPFEGSLAIQEKPSQTTVYPYQRPVDAHKDIPDWMFEPITESLDNQNPIVAQANTPVSNVTTGNVQDNIPVSTTVSRDGGVNPYITPKNEMLSSIQSVPRETIQDVTSKNNIGMSFEEFTTPPDINTMDEVQKSIVERAMRSGQPAQVPTGVMADAVSSDVTASTSTGLLDKLGGAENVLGASMMAGGNLLAMNQYGDAISDVQEGLGEIPGMISETLTDAQRETDNVRNYLNTNVESTADASNAKLQASLKNLASNRNQSVGNIKNKTNEIRMNLQQGIDNTIEQAGNRFALQSDRIQESKRASMDAIESMKVELESKKQELEKEKKQAMIGTGVAVGSLLADSVLPGSGQVLRSGWNVYSSNT